MDPVSIFLYGIAIAAGGLVAREIIAPFFIIGKKTLQRNYRRLFERRNILILGAPQSGKTSLILLMVKNRPYLKDAKGVKSSPDKTVGVAVVEDEVSDSLGTKNFNKLEQILADVGGEYVNQWKQLIEELDPHGIVYMLDARKSDDELVEDMEKIFDFVLAQYPTHLRNLRALHIFANFSDSIDDANRRKKPHQIIQIFDRRFSARMYDKLRNLRWNVSTTHLSPDADEWTDAIVALEKFGHDLRWV